MIKYKAVFELFQKLLCYEPEKCGREKKNKNLKMKSAFQVNKNFFTVSEGMSFGGEKIKNSKNKL